ncbi:uncharacterized protein V6R79_010873 [Siganus canaliculatus]
MGGRQSRRRRDHTPVFLPDEICGSQDADADVVSLVSWFEIIEEEKCYDPLDSTLTFVDGEDDLDFLCEDFKSLRAAMSCGHAVTPMSLTKWCRRQLDEGKNKFVCGQHGCDAEWSYDEVRKMALLTTEETEYFETKLFSNAAKNHLDVKQCPGCKSHVLRADPKNLNVECPMCTADKGKRYQFCWQCLRQWKGPAPRSDHCGNEDCVSPLEILKNCPDIVFEDIQGVTGCPSIRACPTCGLLVEHNKSQCKHVVCHRCKSDFCFVCLKLSSDCMQLHIKTQTSCYDPDRLVPILAPIFYGLCTTGVAPRQTSIPVWDED